MEYIVLQLLYLGLHFIDYGQTREIVRNSQQYYETNKLLGNHPNNNKVTAYFITTAIGHTVITYYLPERYKQVWLGSTIALETYVTSRNANLGLSFNF